MGNTIYSFSLDDDKHQHFKRMMRQTRNKSAMIRHALHQVELLPANRRYRKFIESKLRQYEEWLDLPPINLTMVWQSSMNQEIDSDRLKAIEEELLESLSFLQEVRKTSQEQE